MPETGLPAEFVTITVSGPNVATPPGTELPLRSTI
jgi:hypothetical protein